VSTIRVASYNLKDLTLDRRAAARVVRALDPDVLCLQEVPRRAFGSWRVASFAGLCGMYWSGRHRGSGGTTILTSLRVTVTDARHHRLSVRFPQRTRGYAVARVAAPGHPPFVVASVHLSLDALERDRHAEQILRTVSGSGSGSWDRSWDGPVLVAGDLNEEDSGAAWRRIAASLRLVSPADPTFPARNPNRLLDVVFASPGVTVLPHREVAIPEADLVAASDHRPTWVDIDL
jgi:endonuclease/exonuclease/phosphatase family metal-dependent hydrolase